MNELDLEKEVVKPYCINCGSDEYSHVRNTASYSCDTITVNVMCDNCGEEYSFIEVKE